jgi:hypothetical protein
VAADAINEDVLKVLHWPGQAQHISAATVSVCSLRDATGRICHVLQAFVSTQTLTRPSPTFTFSLNVILSSCSFHSHF